jgi:hypothetical protein
MMAATSEVETGEMAATSKSSEVGAAEVAGASVAVASEEAAVAETGKMMMFPLTTPTTQARLRRQAHNSLLRPMDKDMEHQQEAILAVATNRLLNNTVVDLIITVAHMPKAMAVAMTMHRTTITKQLQIKLGILLII